MEDSAIKTPLEYQQALKEIEGLMDAARGTPRGERLDKLVTLVEAWEAQHYPIERGSRGR